jgi:hypothetical protein
MLCRLGVICAMVLAARIAAGHSIAIHDGGDMFDVAACAFADRHIFHLPLY